jgi:NADH dehydrogenase FAD-containing subunit
LNVVIIGGGYGGCAVASKCASLKIPFKIIDKNEYFHHCVGALRASVIPEYGKKVAIPLKQAYQDNFVQGSVKQLDTEGKKVILENGDELEFTHCVIAVGSLGPLPARSKQTTIDGLLGEYLDISDKISKAKNIVVVGGGPVGVEMAGQIREKHKDVEITLISSSEKLVSPQFDDKFQSNMKSMMTNKNVKVEIGKAVNLSELETNVIKEQQVKLSTDTEISYDLLISCIGLPPNKDSITSLVPEDKLDQNNRIKVNNLLQVEGYENIFAIGDCCNTEENKMAAYADAHGLHVVGVISNTAKGKQVKPYKTSFVGMLVPVGSNGGVGNINGMNLPGPIVTVLKSRDLFTSKFWKGVGLKVPE